MMCLVCGMSGLIGSFHGCFKVLGGLIVDELLVVDGGFEFEVFFGVEVLSTAFVGELFGVDG